MMGGGGGGSGSAPQNFLPPGQSEVAGQLPGLIGPMRDQSVNALNALNGVSPAQSAYPFVQGTASNILNNPFQANAVNSAQYGNDFFNNLSIPTGIEGASSLSNLARLASQAFQTGAGGALNNPAYDAAAGIGGNLSGGFQGAVNQALGDVYAPEWMQAIQAGQHLSGGFQGAQAQALGDVFAPQYRQAIDVGQNLSSGFQRAQAQALGDVSAPQYRQAIGYGQRDASQLHGASASILDSAFDPQKALYDRTLQQVEDQQNAINSQYGIASSPYGAGVAGQRASDFNLDWQDRQLQRRMAGGQAAGALDLAGISAITNPSLAATQAMASDIGAGAQAGQSALSSILSPSLAATQAAASDIGAGAQAGQSALSSILSPSLAANQAAGNSISSASNAMSSALGGFLTPANAQSAARLQGSSALGNLSGIANQDFGSATSGLTGLASGIGQFGGQPYSAYNTVQGNNFGALQNEINLGNANYLLPQQTVSNLEQYLGLGQSASQIASQIASTNNQIGQTNFNQLSSGLGGASQLAFGSQGPFGAGGLLGSLGGGAASTGQLAGLFPGAAAGDLAAYGAANPGIAAAAPLAFSA